MNLSYQWLNDYIDLSDQTPETIADLLTMKTCEVEKVIPFMPHLAEVTVAEVVDVQKHPDADKLVICQVDTGKEKIQIVTGAPNVEAKKKYPLAAIGVTLPGGMTMKKAKLRGQESSGMLCSARELELEEFTFGPEFSSHSDGLLNLPGSFKAGQSLGQALNISDTILDIDNKSITHRPDLWSHFGFARELAALLNKPLKSDPADLEVTHDASLDAETEKIKITINDDAALNYSGAILDKVKVEPSSLKMQARLVAAGMRPINNVVDVSNYVMLALGQPNHAFDRSDLAESIVIDKSKEKEKITTLDGNELTLPAGIVLVRDGEKPVALGGVMGGEDTEVKDSTTRLFLESATFHRADIRRAVSQLGIRTEASQRFEKGQNPENSITAIHLFVSLLKETCPDLVMGKIKSEFKEKVKQNQVSTSLSYLRQRLGKIELADNDIKKLLESLGMKVEVKGDALSVTVPPHRSYFDITIAEDLVEEIGRLVGYQQIEIEPLMVSCEVPQAENYQRKLEHHLRDLMCHSYSFSEVYRYAFHSKEDIDLDKRFADAAIEMQNPIHSDLGYMRISPLPGLVNNVASYFKEHNDLRLFEIERIFLKSSKTDELPEERTFIAGVIYNKQPADKNMLELSALLGNLLGRLNLPLQEQQWISLAGSEAFHPGRAGQVKHGETTLFSWGQVHPRITDVKGLPPVFYFEGFLDDLVKLVDLDVKYRPLVKFPASDFEVTVLLDQKTPYSELLESLGEVKLVTGEVDKTYIESIEHLATYTGDQIEPGKKAVSVRITWRNNARTLQPDEIKDLQQRVVRKLEHNGLALKS